MHLVLYVHVFTFAKMFTRPLVYYTHGSKLAFDKLYFPVIVHFVHWSFHITYMYIFVVILALIEFSVAGI